MVGQDRPIWDFEDIGDNWTRVHAAGIAPVVAVPTTAGPGSEVGRAAVIVAEAGPAKKIISHPRMPPHLVIADPEVTLALPPQVTPATCLEAHAHFLQVQCPPILPHSLRAHN